MSMNFPESDARALIIAAMAFLVSPLLPKFFEGKSSRILAANQRDLARGRDPEGREIADADLVRESDLEELFWLAGAR